MSPLPTNLQRIIQTMRARENHPATLLLYPLPLPYLATLRSAIVEWTKPSLVPDSRVRFTRMEALTVQWDHISQGLGVLLQVVISKRRGTVFDLLVLLAKAPKL